MSKDQILSDNIFAGNIECGGVLQKEPQYLYCGMETPKSNEKAGAKKPGPGKLPSKQISFTNQPTGKKGKQGGKTLINTQKKGGVNLMKKLSGM
jgi:hypothetical protein